MAINIGDNFSYQGKKYLDGRQSFDTLSEMNAYTNVPDGFIAYCKEDKKRYEYVDGVWVEYTVSATVDTTIFAEKTYVDDIIRTHHHDERYLQEHQDISHLATKEEIEAKGYLTEHQDISHLATKAEIPSLDGLVTTEELEQKGYLTEHQDISHLATKEELEGIFDRLPEQEIDTSNLATKEELNTKFDDVEVNEEETTDSQTALDFFANGEKVKTVYFSGGGGGGGATAAYISTTLPEEAMVETGYDFDILLDFYSPNPGKGTLKVFVNDVDALSTPIIQGETTTTLSHEKLTKGTNKIVVYVLDRIGTMSNSLTFYVRYGSTELVGEFDSSLSYDYGANIRYYFTATALDTSLGLTFYMSIDGAVQNGVSCVSDVRGYFTFPNSLEAGGHYCECWVEDSKGGKSNIEIFNLVILDNNTLAIVTETRNPSVEEGSQLVLDYRVYKKNETTFIIKTYVDEELVSTGTCGLTTSYYKTTTLREGMHNIKIEAWDITETVSDYVTWTVIITPSTYTMLEPIKAGSMFIASAKNRTNGDPNRETWTGYDQDNNAIDSTLYNFAFNSESGWMDDQLFITGNSYVEVPIQPLANNARYGFTLDIEFSTKPIGVDDAEVLSLWNDTDNCGIKITTEQLILQSKTGNKCELYFSENEIVSAIFIIDRHEKTAKVYLNGVMCAAFALSDYVAEGVSYLEDFTVNSNLYLGKPGSNGYATIKNLRIYELALSSSEILNNFMANEIDKAKQQALVNFQKGEDLPTVTIYCDFSGLGKDDKKYCDIVYNSPDPVKYGESFSLMGKYSQLQYQGTSSMQYPIKNYRLNPKDKDGKVKIKLPFCQPETRFTLKADFMASGHWQNTGLTKWINENLYNYKEDDPKTMNPAKWWAIQNGKDPNDYRECIYGFPCRLILVNDGNSPLNEGQQEPTPGNTKDMGIFNFNLDKDCENSLGFKIKDFPNALSMEVTANSDTSAGAFMTFKEKRLEYIMFSQWGGRSIRTDYIRVSDWNKWMVGEVKSEGGYIEGSAFAISDTYDANYNSLNSRNITADTVYVSGMINHTGDSWGSGTINEDMRLALENGDLSINGNKIYLHLIYNHNSVYAIDPSSWPRKGIYVIDEDVLTYIKESFELRYPDEDDVPEGWGFMGVDVPLTAKAIGKWLMNGNTQYTSVFKKHADVITVETQHNNEWFVAMYNEGDGYIGHWTANLNVVASGNSIDISNRTETHIAIGVKNTLQDEYIFINGIKYYFKDAVENNGILEPYDYETDETYFDTTYGLKSLIDWVDNSTDEQFVAEFEEHFHKDYTLRYFLLVMVLGMVDNLGKNMMLDSYDGKIWMPRFYDCDTICSYDNSGAIKFDVDIEMQQGYWNTSSSRLWTRVRDLFHDELVVKYNDMRQNGLSFESLMNVFYNEQIAKIPQKYYNMDADVKYLPYADEYLGKAHGDGYEHLKRWLKNRIIFTDSLYDYAPSYTNDMITFRANTTEEMTITIETYTPVYQHVSWYNGNMQKEKIAKGTQLTFKGFAQAATDQEVLVYGGSNIKRIIGISTMNPNSMLIGNATRLVELDISDCPILTDINSNKANFTPHTYLNKLDISNCPQLGGSLRLNYSPLIGEINAMNTAVTDLQLPSSIRNLHTLKVPGALTNLTLNDGPVLSTLEFDGPNKLQSVNLTNCNALTNVINFDMTQIPSVTLNNSYDADELYMSKTTNLSLVNMANIKRLIFLPNNEHETFNLTQLRNYPDYTISAINCPSLKTFMTTAPYRRSYGLLNESDNERYIPLEYIETDMSQYIETDYHVNSKTKVVADMHVMEFMEWGYMFGSNNMRVQFDSSGIIHPQGFTIDPSGDADLYKTRQTWIVMSTTSSNDSQPFHIFSGSTSQNIYRTAGRLYSMKIYEGDEMVRDYIPCIEKQTLTVCLYDAINDNFVYPAIGKLLSPSDNVVGIEAFCANTLDISNTKITDVNFLCTTDLYQLKLPDTVNNFICDSAYDLDTDYLPDGDFDTVHHEFIEAYTTDYSSGVYMHRPISEIIDDPEDYTINLTAFDMEGIYGYDDNGFSITTENWNNGAWVSRLYNVYPETTCTMDVISIDPNTVNGNYTIGIGFCDSDGKLLKSHTIRVSGRTVSGVVPSDAEYVVFTGLTKPTDYGISYKVTVEEMGFPQLIPSAADGSLIFSMYAPNVNTAVPAEGIWDLYGLTFEEFYTYGMNNDIVVTDGNITMPNRYADYNVTIQNANIKPTNHPTMLYPLLVNEDKPIVGTIDYSDYQGDDLSYAMAYANKAEVDISIPNDVALSTQHIYNIDTQSEYEYNDPKTIAKYTCNAKGVLPTFNSGYSAYKVSERDNGDGTYTTSIIADDISNLPTVVKFTNNSNLLEVTYLNTSNVSDMYVMFQKCSKVTKINTDNWDTSKVKTMENMFEGCSKLTSLDVSKWDVSNVTTFKSMFYNCTSLTSLDVNNWDTSGVTDMQTMFQRCSSLTSLDLSGWDISSVTTIRGMFTNCLKLEYLDISTWDTSKIVSFGSNSNGLFQDCPVLKSDKFPTFDFSSASDITRLFQNCHGITELHFKNFKNRGPYNDGYNNGNWIWSKSLITITGLDFTYKQNDTITYSDISCENLEAAIVEGTISKSIYIYAPKLSIDSIMSLINALVQLNGETKTLNIGTLNINKLTSQQIAIATNKGWTLV